MASGVMFENRRQLELDGKLGEPEAFLVSAGKKNRLLFRYPQKVSCGDNPQITCDYRRGITLGFVYEKRDAVERRSPILSVDSLLAHNPYWEDLTAPVLADEARRIAALPQVAGADFW